MGDQEATVEHGNQQFVTSHYRPSVAAMNEARKSIALFFRTRNIPMHLVGYIHLLRAFSLLWCKLPSPATDVALTSDADLYAGQLSVASVGISSAEEEVAMGLKLHQASCDTKLEERPQKQLSMQRFVPSAAVVKEARKSIASFFYKNNLDFSLVEDEHFTTAFGALGCKVPSRKCLATGMVDDEYNAHRQCMPAQQFTHDEGTLLFGLNGLAREQALKLAIVRQCLWVAVGDVNV